MKLRFYIGFTAAILLVLLVGFKSWQTFKQQNAVAANVKDTYRMLTQMQAIRLLLIDMETGRRGFRSTNETRFLDPYVKAITKIHPEITRLKLLAVDKDVKARIPDLEKHIDQLIEFWTSIGIDASNFSRDYLTDIMDREEQQMDVIRKEINYITEFEQVLLVRAEKENDRSIENATRALIASISLILVIVLTLIYFIIKAFNTRKKAEKRLKASNTQLEKLNHESSEQNWLLAGVAEVNNSLHGDRDHISLTQAILDAVINYLRLDAGAFYIFNEENNTLALTAKHAISGNVKKSYRLNEGHIGRSVMLKETLIVKDVVPEFAVQKDEIADLKQVQALYFPIFFDEELKGVIELLTYDMFLPEQRKFLSVICDNVAVALNSAQARENVLRLLKQVQTHKQALELQREKLRQANEELSHQTEILQHSEEELKVQEEELRQINAELQEKNEAVETARQAVELKARELEVTSKYKSEFLANMSHELRTPLNSVLILARLLSENKDQNLNEKQISHARLIHKSGSDLLQLINEILDLSKIEAGKIELNIEEVPLKSIAYDIEQLFGVIAEEKNIRFSVNIGEGIPESVQTDKQRVEQVLKNLLSNAFKFTANNGEIRLTFGISLKGNTPLLQMIVQDNGIGISPALHRGIFEAFQQADGTINRKYGGTGLGLSISKELVKMLGGSIELESEEGKGSIFRILLPLFNKFVRKARNHLPASNNRAEYGGSNLFNSITDDRYEIKEGDKVLLVIEDDDMFAKIVRQFGLSHNFKTILALTGNEGLQLARQYKPGAIILDMNLPDIDGQAVLKTIKSDNELKNIPVHIISAHDNAIILPEAISYLQKPLSKNDLDNVFMLISEITKNDVKKVLLISGENLKDNVLEKLISNRHLEVHCDRAASVEEAIIKSRTIKYDCVIADIGKNVGPGIAALNILRDHLKQQVPVITYLDEDISSGDDLELKKLSDVVVRRSTLSPERLMDELELFLYKVEQDSAVIGEKRPSSKGPADGTLRDKKALVVDDDMRNIFALTAALESEEMNIITACDGKDALQVLEHEPGVDIILMDIMMPNMDGYQAMNYIRKEMKLSTLPIIALTAKAMTEDKEKCIAAGASDYISKPINTRKLVSLMKIWLTQ